MFYRYRHNFASGLGEWQFVETCEDPDELGYRLSREYNWSDHYRGAEVVSVSRPPTEWLRSEIEHMRLDIKRTTHAIERYEQILKDAELPPPGVMA